MKLYHFTTKESLDQIRLSGVITPLSRTLFSPAPNAVYLTSNDPEKHRMSGYGEDLGSHVELELSPSDPHLERCSSMGGSDVFLYSGRLHLHQYKWSAGDNSDWKPGGVNWKLVAGVAAVGVGAAILGKVAYDSYKKRESKSDAKEAVDSLVKRLTSIDNGASTLEPKNREKKDRFNFEADEFVCLSKKSASKLQSLDYVRGKDAVRNGPELMDEDEFDCATESRYVPSDEFFCVPDYLTQQGNSCKLDLNQ